jgi:hypothetical protein
MKNYILILSFIFATGSVLAQEPSIQGGAFIASDDTKSDQDLAVEAQSTIHLENF